MFRFAQTLFRPIAALFVLPLCAALCASARIPPQEQVPPAGQFQSYVRAASAARDAGHPEIALQNYYAALKLDATWQEGWWNVGTIEYDRDHFADAIPAFRTLAQLAPQASPAWTFLGLCEFETQDYANSLEHLQQGQSLAGTAGDDDPEIARVAKYHLALLLIRGGNFPQATALLIKLSSGGRTSPQVTFALGLARLGLAVLPNALDASRIAQVQQVGEDALGEQRANTAGAPRGELWEAAMHSYAAGQYADAIVQLKEWLQQYPQSGTAWAVLGLSEFALHDYDAALTHLQQGHQLGLQGSAESVQQAEYHLGILLNKTGQFAAAEQILMSTPNGSLAAEVTIALGMSVLRMPLMPDDVAAGQHSLVVTSGEIAALLRDSKYDQAFPKLEALLAKYPNAPFLHYIYGTALAALSQYDDAAKQFRAESALSPQSELPYLGLASLELQRHRPANALPPAQRAVEIAQRSATAHYLLGRSLLESGKPDAAISELQIAQTITPGSPEVHFALAKAYAKSGQPEKATQERSLFAQLNALAERQRSHQGNQAYGAHDAAGVALSAAPQPTVGVPAPR